MNENTPHCRPISIFNYKGQHSRGIIIDRNVNTKGQLLIPTGLCANDKEKIRLYTAPLIHNRLVSLWQ